MDPGDIPANDDLAALHEQLDEAREEVERLRHEAATASARAQTAIVEAASLRSDLAASAGAAEAATTEAGELRLRLEGAQAREREAAERYRDLVVKTEPALPAELIAGDSVDAVEASVEAARAMVTRVRTHIESQAQAGRVPAGSPARSAPDVSMLTPEQKIRYGLAQRE